MECSIRRSFPSYFEPHCESEAKYKVVMKIFNPAVFQQLLS